MEIVKFKKLRSNIYELELDNNVNLKLYDDVIVKYNLLVNKRLDDELLEEINNYNNSLDAYYMSLKYINKKLRCEKEIEEYLLKNNFRRDVIDNTIDKLVKDGYLNHQVYLSCYINDAYNLSTMGPDKIKYNLNKLGFTNDEIEPFLNKDFNSKVIKLIDKKIKSNNKLSGYVLKQNISNYLINLGYPRELFGDYLSQLIIDDKDTLKREAGILIKKYSKKYDGEKLFYFIKDKLYKKGYNGIEVSEVLNELL
jgi:regulatory protein